MNRREFLLASMGAGGALAAASGPTAAEPGRGRAPADPGAVDGDGSTLFQEDGNGADDEVTVELVNYAFEPGTEEALRIEPGTTVRFVWVTDSHNIVVESQPEGADWGGHEGIENGGYEYTFTFETEGTYEFVCTPHEQLGMQGTIEVGEGDEPAAVPPAEREIDPHEIGVPLQKHFIGIATFFSIFLTLVFTFYVLKYGETPHSGSPNRK